MTQAQQSEALRLAAICETKGMFPVADELNRMHARILELEQGKCLLQIAEPAAQQPDAHAKAAIATLTSLGYTWIGGEQWKPPIGKAPDFNLLDAMHARIEGLEAQLAAAPQAVPAAVAVPDELVRVVDLKSVGDRFYRGNWVSEEGVSELIDAALAATPPAAHPAEGVPAPFSASGIAPCPLCGSASKHVKLGEDRGHRILCWNDDCECSSGYFSSKEDAIASWNSRAALANTQPAAQGMDAPWIHVSERLPELRQQVLAGYFYQDTWLKGRPWVFSVGVCSMYENPEDPCFPQGKRWQTHGCSHNDIAYWMPMPKSPELPKALAAQAKQGGA